MECGTSTAAQLLQRLLTPGLSGYEPNSLQVLERAEKRRPAK
jgi:hypothetical protein